MKVIVPKMSNVNQMYVGLQDHVIQKCAAKTRAHVFQIMEDVVSKVILLPCSHGMCKNRIEKDRIISKNHAPCKSGNLQKS